MTVLIAKVVSRILLPPPTMGMLRFFVSFPVSIRMTLPLKRELLSFAFLLVALCGVIVYVVEMNIITFKGKQLPQLTQVLQEVEHELKAKSAFLTGSRSPAAVKDLAMRQHMVEVTNVQYINEEKAVALTTFSLHAPGL